MAPTPSDRWQPAKISGHLYPAALRSRTLYWLDTIATGDKTWVIYINQTRECACCASGGELIESNILNYCLSITDEVYFTELQRLAEIRKKLLELDEVRLLTITALTLRKFQENS